MLLKLKKPTNSSLANAFSCWKKKGKNVDLLVLTVQLSSLHISHQVSDMKKRSENNFLIFKILYVIPPEFRLQCNLSITERPDIRSHVYPLTSETCVVFKLSGSVGILFGSFRYRSPLKSLGIFLGTCEMSSEVTANVLFPAFGV